MIEMLAVLVIVGILSTTALAGLMSAWAKHKANLIVHDVVLMAVDLIQDHALGSDFIPEADVLYTIDTYDKSFTVTAKNISKRVCKKLLDMNVFPFSDIYINDGEESCGNENDIHFVLSKENLGDVVPCGEKPCVHGRCINNTCQCEDGWTGTYCHLLENGRCGDGTVCDAGEICVNNQCQTCDKEWQTAFCSTYGTDGTCQSLTCKTTPCHEVRFDSVATCCLTGYSGYCTRYNADGTCANVGCTKGTCTSVNIDQAGGCCTPEQTPYCSNYNAADQCTTVRCGDSRCTQERIDSIGTCCQSGRTPYCIKYNTDETCASASCMSGVCEQDRIDTLGACCRSDQTIYCSRYDATGQCTAVDCASAPCTPMSFDTIGVCVPLSRFAFCNSYKTDGKCAGVSYALSSAYATPYCTRYYPDTTQCQTGNVCYGTVTQDADGKDVCTQ